MENHRFDGIRLAQHVLRISEPNKSIPFYTEKLGFTLCGEHRDGSSTYYTLAYQLQSQAPTDSGTKLRAAENTCLLTLVHRPSQPPANIRKQPDMSEGYWKIALAVKDLDIAHTCLVENGVDVDTPRQIPNIAYLCHFSDPDGYCIELIQHDFADNHTAGQVCADFALGTKPTFSLITLRSKDIEKSQNFYEKLLGMRLLSRQTVDSRQFTLYFFAVTDDSLPNADVDHIDNREWLWRRPYTMLELQHVWGTESNAEFDYRTGAESGFEEMSFACEHFDDVLLRAQSMGVLQEASDDDPISGARAAYVFDPDGFRIRILDALTQEQTQNG